MPPEHANRDTTPNSPLVELRLPTTGELLLQMMTMRAGPTPTSLGAPGQPPGGPSPRESIATEALVEGLCSMARRLEGQAGYEAMVSELEGWLQRRRK